MKFPPAWLSVFMAVVGSLSPAQSDPPPPPVSCPEYLVAVVNERLPELEAQERFFLNQGVAGNRILLQQVSPFGGALLNFDLIDLSGDQARVVGRFENMTPSHLYGGLAPLLSATGNTVLFANSYIDGEDLGVVVTARKLLFGGALIEPSSVAVNVLFTRAMELPSPDSGDASLVPPSASLALIPGKPQHIALAVRAYAMDKKIQLSILKLSENGKTFAFDLVATFDDLVISDSIHFEGVEYKMSRETGTIGSYEGFSLISATSDYSDYVLRQHHPYSDWDPTLGRTLNQRGDNLFIVNGKMLNSYPVRSPQSSLAIMLPNQSDVFIWEWPMTVQSQLEIQVDALFAAYSSAELWTAGIRIVGRQRPMRRPEGNPLLYLWDPQTGVKTAVQNAQSLVGRRSEFLVALVHRETMIIGTTVGTLLWFDLKQNKLVREQSFETQSPIDDLQWDSQKQRFLVLHRSGEIRSVAREAQNASTP